MKYHLIILLFFLLHFANAQNKMAFKSGEWFKYKLSYSGWFKAGEATVNLSEVNSNNKLLHAKMIGKSTGALNLFFKVSIERNTLPSFSIFPKRTIKIFISKKTKVLLT